MKVVIDGAYDRGSLVDFRIDAWSHFGYETLLYYSEGSYQGELYAVLRSKVTKALHVLDIGYGSCTGCDDYISAMSGFPEWEGEDRDFETFYCYRRKALTCNEGREELTALRQCFFASLHPIEMLDDESKFLTSDEEWQNFRRAWIANKDICVRED